MTDFARGDRLLELREQRRMSREKVAGEIGVTTKSLYEWEKNSGAIKFENAEKLAAFYEIANAEELVTRDPEATGPSTRGQVGEAFEEFRAYVREINEKLDAAEEDRAAMRKLIDTQNALLAEQTVLITTLQDAVAELPALDRLLRRLGGEGVDAPRVPRAPRAGEAEGGAG